MTDEQPRTGARQRRRGLYGPPPRLTRTSALTGRLVWHIGDWGRASEHIGARWEHVAGALARDRIGPDEYLVVLAATPALMAEVLGSGLPHADAVMERGVLLPLSHAIDDDTLDYVLTQVQEFLDGTRTG